METAAGEKPPAAVLRYYIFIMYMYRQGMEKTGIAKR